MNRRKIKKRAKRYMDWFSKAKIPAAFASENERRLWVRAWARAYVGQRHTYPSQTEVDE